MLTLAAPHAHEEEVKRSRFLARAARAENRSEAAAFIAAAAEPKADHNCWAYRIGQDYRFSDDGEPGGTAGQPILRAIESRGLDHVVCVVSRWFGGVKLGAGGLARAYGGCAAECLRTAARVEVLPQVRLRLQAPFALIGAVYTAVEASGARRLGEEYGSDGVTLDLACDAAKAEALRAAVRDATRGGARFLPV